MRYSASQLCREVPVGSLTTAETSALSLRLLKGASPSAVVPTELSVYNSPPIHSRLQYDPSRGDSSWFHSVSQRPGKNTRGNGTIAGRISSRTAAGRCSGFWNLSMYMRPLAARRAYGPLEKLARRRQEKTTRCCR